jgi:hypothetical protein
MCIWVTRTTRLRHLMFLDSGADISLIPASVGLALGLLPEDSPTTSVRGFVAERAGLHIVELHLQIGDTVEWPFRVGLADNDNVPSLLGRLDVFDHYTFEFNHERRMVVVKQ